jgi:carbamoylphosphate synthase large subunit
MKLLFIGARLFEDVALYTKRMGITSVLTESNPNSKNLNLADSYHLVSRGMDEPREIALKEDVDGIVPLIGVDGPLLDVAMLKKELEEDHGLPVVASPPSVVSISEDKIKTKEFLIKNDIKTPEHFLISPEQGLKLRQSSPALQGHPLSMKQELPPSMKHELPPSMKHELPLVLKQAQGQGGRDIKIAISWEDVESYLEQFDTALVEKFMEGVEISVEIIRWRKKAVPLVPVYKGKTTLEGIHPLNKVKKAPLEIDNVNNHENNQKIRDLALKIGELLGVEGCADVDLIFDGENKHNYVLEINTRPSGTRYLTAASSDINPLHQLVDMAAGVWNAAQVRKKIKEYSALEIPVYDYSTNRNNHQFREFYGENSWIIHGPPNHQRITIRGKDSRSAFETAEKLNLNLEDF